MLELNVLTLNVWGIPIVSKNRKARIEAIAEELSSGKYDIVSLQEVWSQSDCQLIKEKTKSVLPFSYYFFSGVIGAGLLVLSKYPIIGSLFHAWCVNGYFHRIQHADWFGGKGVGLCKIRVGAHLIHLYNAHLHAEYNDENDEYKTHRVIQAYDTAQFIEATRGDSVLQILAGDLNTKPEDITYKVLLYTSNMVDACTTNAISTNECQRNSYTAKRLLKKNPNGIRIDHIFLRITQNIKISIMEHSLPFLERVPSQKFSYSDHEAILLRLKLQQNDKIETSSHNNGDVSHVCIDRSYLDSVKPSYRIAALKESIELCNQSLHSLNTDRIIYYVSSIILFMVLIAMVEFNVPSGYKTIYLILKFIIFGIIIFCLFMGSIWNLMERNGVLSGKLSMEMLLKNIEKSEFHIL